jgi:di/tricarboxylate transporter
MGTDAWVTAAVLVAVVVVLVWERLPAPVAVLGGVVTLVLTGVITPLQGFGGFSSEAPITIAALFVVAGAARSTGALDVFVSAAIGRPGPARTYPRRRELARILLPAAAMSTVVYNTPTVGLLAPQVAAWAKRTQRPSSWYLLPLNYAVLLGGLVTAIGTTTNVVTSGLLVTAGMRPLGLFELAPIGLPLTAAGLVIMTFLAPRLMPDRVSTADELEHDFRDFALQLDVDPTGTIIGQTVAAAGLRSLEGTFLVQIARGDQLIAPVAPQEVLQANDTLTFIGNVARVMDLQQLPGLRPSTLDETDQDSPFSSATFYEAVLSQGSTMVGRTPKELDFRAQFGSAILAVHRDGERLAGKLGEIRLRGGDVLLILAGPDSGKLQRGQGDFLVLAPLGSRSPTVRRQGRRLVQVLLGLFLLAVSTGLLDVLHASLAVASALLLLRVVTITEARSHIDIDVLVTLAASFGLGAAVSASGLATSLAHALVDGFSWAGPLGILVAVLLATAGLTQIVTNNAAAIVMFPIALATAHSAGQPVRPFVLAVVVAASLSFLTPFGYQTNLIVAGLANYRARDFLPLGLVLMVVSLLATTAVLGLSLQ